MRVGVYDEQTFVWLRQSILYRLSTAVELSERSRWPYISLQSDPFGCGYQTCFGRIRLRPCCGEIVRNMQAKPSLANLMRVAHTLDVVSIVNEHRSVREALTDVVFSAGYVPEPFESADEFLKSGRRLITSCLIADMQSSVMSGFELFHHLAGSGGVIPTVLLTDNSEDDMSRVLQAGLQFLSKPFERSELLACVRSQIMNRNYSLWK